MNITIRGATKKNSSSDCDRLYFVSALHFCRPADWLVLWLNFVRWYSARATKCLYCLFVCFVCHTRIWKLRALHLLGRCSTTWAMPQPFFALVIFLIGSHVFYPWSDLDCDPPTSSSSITGVIGVPPPQPLVYWDRVLLTFLPGIASNCYPPDLHLMSSWD
jgi:hypothetical protein